MSQCFRYECPNATDFCNQNSYKVKKGSRCNIDHHETWSYTKLKENLINDKILKKEEDYYIFEKDYCFESPSAAASIILGKQSPGPLDWKI